MFIQQTEYILFLSTKLKLNNSYVSVSDKSLWLSNFSNSKHKQTINWIMINYDVDIFMSGLWCSFFPWLVVRHSQVRINSFEFQTIPWFLKAINGKEIFIVGNETSVVLH